MSFRNLLGTSLPSFRISLSGPTIYQGTVNPTTLPGPFNQGDAYLRMSSTPGWWFYDGATWFEGSTSISGDVIATGYIQAGQDLRVGDPAISINNNETGAGVTGNYAGIVVDRGSLPIAQWRWDDGNDWWQPEGPVGTRKLNAEDGIFLGDGTSGTPSISFVSDPGNGIYYDTTPIFASNAMILATNATPQWVLDQSGAIYPAGTGRNIGTAGIPVNRVYALTFRGDTASTGSVTYGFTGNNNTGMWSPAVNEIGFSAGSTDTLHITSSGLEVLDSTNGYTFQTLSNAGMYVNAGEMSIRAGGVERIRFVTTGMQHTDFSVGGSRVRLPTGSLADPSLFMGTSITGGSAAGVGLYSPAPNTLALVTSDGTNFRDRLTVDSTGLLEVDSTIAYESLVTTDDAIPNRKWVIDNVGVSGANTEIQYNNSGVLGASADFTWNDTLKVLGLNATSPSAIIAEDDLTIRGNNGDSAGPGMTLSCGLEGSIGINAGDANTVAGGDVSIQAGSGVGAVNGGSVSITGGLAGSGIAGSVNITGGGGIGVGPGGPVSIGGGNGSGAGNNSGGDVDISGGNGTGSAAGGTITLTVGAGGPSGTAGHIEMVTNDGATNQGAVIIRGAANQSRLQMRELASNGTEHVELKAPVSIANSRSWTLMQDNPATANGQLLTTDGSGILSFTNSVTPAITFSGGVTFNSVSATFNAGATFNTVGPSFNVAPTFSAGFTSNTVAPTFNAGFTSNTTPPDFNAGAEMNNALYPDTSSGPVWRTGSGSPEGVVTAVVGSLFTDTAGGAGTTLYVKESGTGNTGWVAK